MSLWGILSRGRAEKADFYAGRGKLRAGFCDHKVASGDKLESRDPGNGVSMNGKHATIVQDVGASVTDGNFNELAIRERRIDFGTAEWRSDQVTKAKPNDSMER